MLLSSRIGTSAYDLLPVLQRGQLDDAALALEAAGPLSLGAVTCSSSLSLSRAGLSLQAPDAVRLPEGAAAGHCQLLLACEPLACHAPKTRVAACSKSYINESHYNLDKVFA